MDRIEELEIWIWQNKLLQQEVSCMNDSIKYFSNHKDYQKLMMKFDGYQKLLEKMKYFCTLFPALCETQEDFYEILCLLLGGHYKSCLLVIRTHFELSNAIIRAIKSNSLTKLFCENINKKGTKKVNSDLLHIDKHWKAEIKVLHDELSGFVHANGKTTGHARLNPLPHPMFKESSFEFCINKLNQVVDHNAGLLRICVKPEYWERCSSATVDQYINKLYAHIDSEVVKKALCVSGLI